MVKFNSVAAVFTAQIPLGHVRGARLCVGATTHAKESLVRVVATVQTGVILIVPGILQAVASCAPAVTLVFAIVPI